MEVPHRHLCAFIAIAEERSITRAAARLFLSQPTLSRQLAALECELGVTLVERGARSVQLTAAGRALLPDARAAVRAHDDLLAAARAASRATVGELRIGTLFSLSLGVLPRLIATWRERHPDVRVELLEFRHPDAVADALRAGEFDLAIGPVPRDWAGGMRSLGTEELVVVAPDGACPCAAGAAAVSLRELTEALWVHYPPGNGLGVMLDTACAQAGFSPRVALRTEQARAAAEFARHGLGYALVPCNVVPECIACSPLDPALRRDVSAYWRAPGQALVGSFVRHAVAAATADAVSLGLGPRVALSIERGEHLDQSSG